MCRVVTGLIISACLMVGPAVQAGQTSEQEREALAALATEIEFLDVLAGSAENRMSHESRQTFDYAALRSKFGEIKQQIDSYLAEERKQPRQLFSSTQK